MTTSAVLMMIVAMLVVWGGLVASVLFLRARPEVDDAELPDPDAAAPGGEQRADEVSPSSRAAPGRRGSRRAR
ncbi:methionine/alanine import family NSS transporter small subunit [uncultured Serinicoccus sp.]|uniref:methionine/alanine import family NSS transporter small subunit n=1 Tax=uncultured Serinicoccus sp. TaxID=735514 RepID=UPI0026138B0E|nr:methionine/alanine import family NSS transporter small subunit [uncultured Serinicoccus sp.]